MNIFAVKVIQFRQQMQQRQAEQKRASEGIEQLHVPRLMQLESKYSDRAQQNAGKQNQVIHMEGRPDSPDDGA
jgi:hypothetical protein